MEKTCSVSEFGMGSGMEKVCVLWLDVCRQWVGLSEQCCKGMCVRHIRMRDTR